jgi:hypothetical protein
MGIIAIAPGDIPSVDTASSVDIPVDCATASFVFLPDESPPFLRIDFADFRAGFEGEAASKLYKTQS